MKLNNNGNKLNKVTNKSENKINPAIKINYNQSKTINMLKINKLHKSYPIGDSSLHVLKGIDLNVEDGEMVAIMGSSGSGKSTLLNILGILDNYDQGSYYLNGTLVKDMSEKKAARLRNELVGFVFQSFNLISFKGFYIFFLQIRKILHT